MNDDFGLVLIWIGAWLAVAAGVLALWRAARARVRRAVAMPKDGQPRSWRPRHRGRPALVRPADHQGATADWSPTGTVGEAAVSEELLTAEERKLLLSAEIEVAVEIAIAPMRVGIDGALHEFMTRHGISWDDVQRWETDAAATEIIDRVDGDLHALSEELTRDLALSTPTGEFPAVIPAQQRRVMPV